MAFRAEPTVKTATHARRVAAVPVAAADVLRGAGRAARRAARSRGARSAAVVVVVVAFGPGPAAGQTLRDAAGPPPAGAGGGAGVGVPGGAGVDAGVADTDPFAASRRKLEPGLARFPVDGRVRTAGRGATWRATDASRPWLDPLTGLRHVQPRRYRAPGVRALVGRTDYATPRGDDGRVMPGARPLALGGPAVVYELPPEPVAAAPPPRGPRPATLLDNRLRLRLVDERGRPLTDADGADRGADRVGVSGVLERVVNAAVTPAGFGAVPRRRVRNGPAGVPARPPAEPGAEGRTPAAAGADARETGDPDPADIADAAGG